MLAALPDACVHMWLPKLFEKVVEKEGPLQLRRLFETNYETGKFIPVNAKEPGLERREVSSSG